MRGTGRVVVSWHEGSELQPVFERAREAWPAWMKLKEREVQLSLWDTPLHATVEERQIAESEKS